MTTVPRHRQSPVTIRSDKAKMLLAQLTRTGRSQAKVIEDMLEEAVAREPKPERKLTKEEFIAAIDAIVVPAHGSGLTYRQLREEYYDENGLPR